MRNTLLVLLLAACSGDKDATDTDTDDTDAADTDVVDTDVPDTDVPEPAVYEPTWTGVQQLFVENCDVCHPAEQGFDLHTDIQNPSASGYDYVVPFDPEASLLWGAVSYEYLSPRMPPTGKLPDETLQAIYDWILAGAVYE